MALFGGKKADLSDPREAWEEFFKAAMKNDWAGSLPLLETLQKLEPHNPQVFMKTGDILQRLKKPAEAMGAYQSAAKLLEDEGELSKALATYKIILRMEPSDEQAIKHSKAIMQALSEGAPATQPEADHEASAYDGEPEAHEAPEPMTQDPVTQDPVTQEPVTQEPDTPVNPPDEPEAPATAAAPSEAPKGQPKGKPKNLREAFARHPVFSVLTDDEIKYMSGKSNHLSLDEGQAVIEEDTTGDSIYVIKKGRANVSTTVMGKTLPLARLGGLAFFGEGGFLTGAPRTASVTAEGPLELMEIPKSLMSDIISKNPQVLGKLIELLRARAAKTPPK